MLYPPLTPFRRGWLDVGDGHQVYWETSGNPQGLPALFLHGGPGGGCTDVSRRWFDPRRFCIITFDQRACGRSTPHGSLEHNTTPHLVSDIEALRFALGVERWIVMGRSWGAALALAYAEQDPARVAAMIVSGVFTGRRREIAWLYEGGAARLFPEPWARLLEPIAADGGGVMAGYHRQLTCGDPAVEIAAARAFCAWEDTLAAVRPAAPRQPDDRSLHARARIQAHYFVNGAFLPEGDLIARASRLAGTPGYIVQGRLDVVTPPATAWELHRAWPGSAWHIVPGAGHASTDPALMRALIDVCDACAATAGLTQAPASYWRSDPPSMRRAGPPEEAVEPAAPGMASDRASCPIVS